MSLRSLKSSSMARRLARFVRRLRTGLLGRFVLVLAAVGLIPLFIIPWLVRLTRDSVVDQILTTHSVTARTTAARVDAWIRSLRISAQTLSSNPFLLEAPRGQVAEMIAGLLQADPAIKGALVVNSAGAEVGMATRSGFSDVVTPSLAAPLPEPVAVIPGDRIWVRITTPLDEGKGELRILVDGAQLNEILKTEEMGRDAIVGLFDASAREIATSEVSGGGGGFPKALLEAGRARATTGTSSYDSGDRILAGAHSPVDAAPWFVASIQPATTAETVASEMRRTGLLAVLLAVTLTGLFSALGYVAVIRPIDELARSQWKAAKRGNKAVPEGNEISQLQEGFAALRRQTNDREAIGKIFLSRYLVLDLLGTGGMGSVFRGWDPKLERPVAIKTIHMGGGDHAASVGASEQRQALLREAVTVAKFNHPNIVAIYDVEDTEQAAFLAMEFVEGMSLENLLAKIGLLRLEIAVPLIIQISRGLEAAHNGGVVHCDIKPANILLGRDGTIKVTDFGIARSAARGTGKLSGIFGTPGYLPPESLTAGSFTPMADLFAVGAVFYEALIGETPHAGKNTNETLVRTVTVAAPSVRERNKSVPPAIDEIIRGLLEKDPALRRPTSAKELADTLEVIAMKNGWKWAVPPALTSGASTADKKSESPTAEIPDSQKLG